jgi:hypothetical protein
VRQNDAATGHISELFPELKQPMGQGSFATDGIETSGIRTGQKKERTEVDLPYRMHKNSSKIYFRVNFKTENHEAFRKTKQKVGHGVYTMHSGDRSRKITSLRPAWTT